MYKRTLTVLGENLEMSSLPWLDFARIMDLSDIVDKCNYYGKSKPIQISVKFHTISTKTIYGFSTFCQGVTKTQVRLDPK